MPSRNKDEVWKVLYVIGGVLLAGLLWWFWPVISPIMERLNEAGGMR